MQSITPTDLAALGDTATIVDVRERDEYDAAHVPGVIHVALSELTRAKLKALEQKTSAGGRIKVGFARLRWLHGNAGVTWHIRLHDCIDCDDCVEMRG